MKGRGRNQRAQPKHCRHAAPRDHGLCERGCRACVLGARVGTGARRRPATVARSGAGAGTQQPGTGRRRTVAAARPGGRPGRSGAASGELDHRADLGAPGRRRRAHGRVGARAGGLLDDPYRTRGSRAGRHGPARRRCRGAARARGADRSVARAHRDPDQRHQRRVVEESDAARSPRASELPRERRRRHAPASRGRLSGDRGRLVQHELRQHARSGVQWNFPPGRSACSSAIRSATARRRANARAKIASATSRRAAAGAPGTWK